MPSSYESFPLYLPNSETGNIADFPHPSKCEILMAQKYNAY